MRSAENGTNPAVLRTKFARVWSSASMDAIPNIRQIRNNLTSYCCMLEEFKASNRPAERSQAPQGITTTVCVYQRERNWIFLGWRPVLARQQFIIYGEDNHWWTGPPRSVALVDDIQPPWGWQFSAAEPWQIDPAPIAAGQCDAEGWMYAIDFGDTWDPVMSATSCVRMRKYIRRAVRL